MFHPKKILIAALFIVTCLVGLIGLGTLKGGLGIYYYIQFFAIDGFV